MFITMPIARIEFTDNILRINENSFHYNTSNIFDAELLESLISKGAYASALLYLNKTSLLESINETKVTKKEFKKYLQECKNLLKENVYESKASNLRPLCSINGLEILESDTNIYRGKNKLLVEDFRKPKKALKEQDITMSESSEDGWGDDIEDLTSEFFDKVDRVDYEIKNARRGSYGIEGDTVEDLARVFEDISAAAQEISEMLLNAEVNYSSDEDFEDSDDLNEEIEGTQTSDIASKRDQNLGGKVMVSSKKKKLEEHDFNVGINHRFKGFILNSEGRYERGNYVLVKEGEKIKAIHKRKLSESYTDSYGDKIFTQEKAESKLRALCKTLNQKFSDYGFEFAFRIEEGNLKIFDINEEFDYEDKMLVRVENIVKKVFGNQAYLEPENSVIFIIAGCYTE